MTIIVSENMYRFCFALNNPTTWTPIQREGVPYRELKKYLPDLHLFPAERNRLLNIWMKAQGIERWIVSQERPIGDTAQISILVPERDLSHLIKSIHSIGDVDLSTDSFRPPEALFSLPEGDSSPEDKSSDWEDLGRNKPPGDLPIEESWTLV